MPLPEAELAPREHGTGLLLSDDRLFRSRDATRMVDQVAFLLRVYGTPRYMHVHERLGLASVTALAPLELAPLSSLLAHSIESRVRNACEKWVKEKGCIFCPRDGVDGHHGTIKLRWEMLPANAADRGGEAISIGFDFLVLGGDGRIRTGYQFIEA